MTRDPDDILNWRRVDRRVTLSGQPTAEQFRRIRDLGVTQVINLAPHDSPDALAGEPDTVAGLGMGYTYIPVNFDAPTDADFNRFCTAMAEHARSVVHVHCIYNARVSAFMLRYALSGLGGDIGPARALMDSIWRPGGVWAEFLGDTANCELANRYAGHDY